MRDLREALAPRRASRGPRSVGKSAPGKSGFDRYRKNTFGLRTNLANGLTVRGITPTGLGPSDQKRLISLTAEDSNLGGFVARHFHPNAYFNDNWGCPRHDILPFHAITTQPLAWSLLRLAGCWHHKSSKRAIAGFFCILFGRERLLRLCEGDGQRQALLVCLINLPLKSPGARSARYDANDQVANRPHMVSQ